MNLFKSNISENAEYSSYQNTVITQPPALRWQLIMYSVVSVFNQFL